MTEIEFTDQDMQVIRNLVYEWTGINISDRKKPMISSRLLKRLREFQLTNMKEYIALVLSPYHPDEKQVFINLVTTNETYFFREYIHFEYLSNILKRLAKQGEKIRIWSAASSSGEEAYSIAMTAAETPGLNGNFSVLATDINSEVIKKGRAGIYTMDRINDLPHDLLKKYCMKGINTQENRLKIIDELRSKVTFEQVNLNEIPPGLGKFHVIFLRNVLIYFQKETKQQILNRVASHILPDGYLVVSLTESLGPLDTELTPVGESFYFKQKTNSPQQAADDNISYF